MNNLVTKFAQIVSNPDDVNIPKPGTDGQLEVALRIVFMTAAVIAVIVIVIAGFTYVMSMGDPQKTAKAKDTILYALIGLAVAIFANVIISFVLGKIFG
jgi:uncharacterized membrane protein (DUF373 family)